MLVASVEEITIYSDHLAVSVAGALPVTVTLEEVGLAEDADGASGGTRTPTGLSAHWDLNPFQSVTRRLVTFYETASDLRFRSLK